MTRRALPLLIALLPTAAVAQPAVVLGVFVKATAKGDPRTKNLWFDVTSVAVNLTPANAARIVERIRHLGVQRILFGSDAPPPNNLPRLTWAAFRKLPLTDAEFRTIENSVAPYVR